MTTSNGIIYLPGAFASIIRLLCDTISRNVGASVAAAHKDTAGRRRCPDFSLLDAFGTRGDTFEDFF
jgi:hypothetical protein